MAIKNYLNSCVKCSNVRKSASCFNLVNGFSLFPNQTNKWNNYSVLYLNKKLIELTYTDTSSPLAMRNNKQVKIYKKLIYIKNSLYSFQDLMGYFDVELGNNLKVYWFKKICLDFQVFREHVNQIEKNIREGEAVKLIGGQFVDLISINSFNGVDSYEFNFNVENKSNRNDAYLTQKHFDFYFSQPREQVDYSLFARDQLFLSTALQ